MESGKDRKQCSGQERPGSNDVVIYEALLWKAERIGSNAVGMAPEKPPLGSNAVPERKGIQAKDRHTKLLD